MVLEKKAGSQREFSKPDQTRADDRDFITEYYFHDSHLRIYQVLERGNDGKNKF